MTAIISFRKTKERSERAILLTLKTYESFVWCGIQCM